ncbi:MULTISPECIES: hypothetical protein [Halorussus]|uniref:hypothetical protein n=1 Tax=Halorussus TaxID=1070314 RepID=UPI0013B38DC2|nr:MULTISPECIES: hypothetical protein [Halorussus]NHN60041.1 hypothetical protein [Halorussus sp. JP-T4]
MAATERRVLIVEEIEAFSTISITWEERQEILHDIDDKIEFQSQSDDISQVSPWLQHLRNTLHRQSLTINLERREHSQLKEIAKRWMRSEELIERLKRGRPECRWCDGSARYQIHLDESDPELICGECMMVLTTPHAYRLLQEIDPTVAPATEIMINDSAVLPPRSKKQTFLSSFADSDPEIPKPDESDQLMWTT